MVRDDRDDHEHDVVPDHGLPHRRGRGADAGAAGVVRPGLAARARARRRRGRRRRAPVRDGSTTGATAGDPLAQLVAAVDVGSLVFEEPALVRGAAPTPTGRAPPARGRTRPPGEPPGMAAAASPRWTPRIAIAPRASPAATASLARPPASPGAPTAGQRRPAQAWARAADAALARSRARRRHRPRRRSRRRRSRARICSSAHAVPFTPGALPGRARPSRPPARVDGSDSPRATGLGRRLEPGRSGPG